MMSTVSIRSPAFTRGWPSIVKIWMAYKAYLVRRQHYVAARTLSGLSDYMLKDMGIARSEIEALVRAQSDDQRCHGDKHDAGWRVHVRPAGTDPRAGSGELVASRRGRSRQSRRAAAVEPRPARRMCVAVLSPPGRHLRKSHRRCLTRPRSAREFTVRRQRP